LKLHNRKFTRVTSLLLVTACGGIIGGGSSDAGSDTDGSGEASADAGFTQCRAPDGVAVCGGPNACATPENCFCAHQESPDNLGLCIWDPPSDGETQAVTNHLCYPGTVEGRACIRGATDFYYWLDAPVSTAILLAQNGGADRARYPDMSLWTGDPIADPSTCTLPDGVAGCGGTCGECAQGECVGRSPLHPLGVCWVSSMALCGTATSSHPSSCPDATDSCFTFSVQPEAQADADAAGFCLPKVTCSNLAQAIPGGGRCG